MDASAKAEAPLLRAENLSVGFRTQGRMVTVVDGIDFTLRPGQVTGLVGESGSGKSVTMLALARLLPESGATVTADRLEYRGSNILGMTRRDLRRLRGLEMGFVFQNPFHSLNPLLPVGLQVREALEQQAGLSRTAAKDRVVELFDRVGIPDSRRRLGDYPHQFSGGMCQRVMIAMAIACEPAIILADEPTTALDVTIQAQILELLTSLVAETGTAIMLVTHDLGIAASVCDHVHVMYAGQIVESASVDTLFYDSRMPYTWGLLDSVPRFDRSSDGRLPYIGGRPPLPVEFGDRCRFAPRCAHARGACRSSMPPLTPRGSAVHLARCIGTQAGGWLGGRDR